MHMVRNGSEFNNGKNTKENCNEALGTSTQVAVRNANAIQTK